MVVAYMYRSSIVVAVVVVLVVVVLVVLTITIRRNSISNCDNRGGS